MKKISTLFFIFTFLFATPAFAEVKPFTKVDFGSLQQRKKPQAASNDIKITVTKKPVTKKSVAEVKTTAVKPVVVPASTQTFAPITYPYTSGSYIGVDFVNTETSYLVRYQAISGEWTSYPPSNKASNQGIGLSYKYAFNFNRFFIAPGIFFEQNGLGGEKVRGRDGVNLKISNHYGIKSDFGYDLTRTIAPYVIFGYGRLDYRTTAAGLDIDNNILTAQRRGHDNNWLYGAGLKINIEKNIALNLEMTSQQILLDADIPPESSDYLRDSSFAGRLNIFKIGLTYNF